MFLLSFQAEAAACTQSSGEMIPGLLKEPEKLRLCYDVWLGLDPAGSYGSMDLILKLEEALEVSEAWRVTSVFLGGKISLAAA